MDRWNYNLRVVNPENVPKQDTPIMYLVSNWAGNGSARTIDGKGKEAGINWPYEIKMDSEGNGYFIAYGSASVRKITPDGTTTTISVGTPTEPYNCPRGIALDKKGNIFIADTGHQILRKISSDNICRRIITDTTFSSPYSIAVGEDGSLYVSDTNHHCIKKITENGISTILAGEEGISGNSDGFGNKARFSCPYGLVLDKEGNIFVADSQNALIRKISPEGMVTTVGGGHDEFSNPYGVALDNRGFIYVADYGNNRIRRMDNYGNIKTIAGEHYSEFECAPHFLSMPTGLTVDNIGNLIVCDCYNHVIRKVTCILDVMSDRWPYSHLDLPKSCQAATLEVALIILRCGPCYVPRELVLLTIRTLILNWPL